MIEEGSTITATVITACQKFNVKVKHLGKNSYCFLKIIFYATTSKGHVTENAVKMLRILLNDKERGRETEIQRQRQRQRQGEEKERASANKKNERDL